MYIISEYNYITKNKEFFIYYFKTKKEAINFIYSKMNNEEIERNIKLQKRKLITENEYTTKNKLYNIIQLKEYIQD